MKFKIIWYVQEYDEAQPDMERLCIPRQQMTVEFSEDELQHADKQDRESIEKTRNLIGERWIIYVRSGRGKIISEKLESIGIMIGKFLRLNLAQHLGETKYLELLPPNMKSHLIPLFPETDNGMDAQS